MENSLPAANFRKGGGDGFEAKYETRGSPGNEKHCLRQEHEAVESFGQHVGVTPPLRGLPDTTPYGGGDSFGIRISSLFRYSRFRHSLFFGDRR
jgi:hypothetical protein